MSQLRYNSFSEFWPHYVAEHSKQTTRLLHLVGTAIALGVVAYFIATGKWWLFPAALIPGYGAAWIGHFFIEKNKAGHVPVSPLVLHGRLQNDLDDVDWPDG